MAAQLFVDSLAIGDWTTTRNIDTQRGGWSDTQWNEGFGALNQAWLVPLFETSPGRWRFGYHTFEARDDFLPSGAVRDSGLFIGQPNVNRLFCVTWDVTTRPSVNQGNGTNNRPQPSEVFDAPESSRLIWTRVDASDSFGLVDTNAVVGDLRGLC